MATVILPQPSICSEPVAVIASALTALTWVDGRALQSRCTAPAGTGVPPTGSPPPINGVVTSARAAPLNPTP